MAKQTQTPKDRLLEQCASGESLCDLCWRIRPTATMHPQADGRAACSICVADGRAVSRHADPAPTPERVFTEADCVPPDEPLGMCGDLTEASEP